MDKPHESGTYIKPGWGKRRQSKWLCSIDDGKTWISTTQRHIQRVFGHEKYKDLKDGKPYTGDLGKLYKYDTTR